MTGADGVAGGELPLEWAGEWGIDRIGEWAIDAAEYDFGLPATFDGEPGRPGLPHRHVAGPLRLASGG